MRVQEVEVNPPIVEAWVLNSSITENNVSTEIKLKRTALSFLLHNHRCRRSIDSERSFKRSLAHNIIRFFY